jgi:excisionase family DNA binding protein
VSATLDEPLFNVGETARLLGVSRRTVYELISTGELPAFRVGGQLRLSKRALAAWLAARRTDERGTPMAD